MDPSGLRLAPSASLRGLAAGLRWLFRLPETGTQRKTVRVSQKRRTGLSHAGRRRFLKAGSAQHGGGGKGKEGRGWHSTDSPRRPHLPVATDECLHHDKGRASPWARQFRAAGQGFPEAVGRCHRLQPPDTRPGLQASLPKRSTPGRWLSGGLSSSRAGGGWTPSEEPFKTEVGEAPASEIHTVISAMSYWFYRPALCDVAGDKQGVDQELGPLGVVPVAERHSRQKPWSWKPSRAEGGSPRGWVLGSGCDQEGTALMSMVGCGPRRHLPRGAAP